MVCCAIIALVLASFFTIIGRLVPNMCKANKAELAWRPTPSSGPELREAEFSWSARMQSVGYASNGLKTVVQEEHNARVHLGAAGAAILIGLYLQIALHAWTWIVLSITLVWFAETVNTAIERLCDSVDLTPNPLIGQAKDIAAGAVLICATSSVILFLLTIAPYLPEVAEPFGMDICGLLGG